MKKKYVIITAVLLIVALWGGFECLSRPECRTLKTLSAPGYTVKLNAIDYSHLPGASSMLSVDVSIKNKGRPLLVSRTPLIIDVSDSGKLTSMVTTFKLEPKYHGVHLAIRNVDGSISEQRIPFPAQEGLRRSESEPPEPTIAR